MLSIVITNDWLDATWASNIYLLLGLMTMMQILFNMYTLGFLIIYLTVNHNGISNMGSGKILVWVSITQ
jgi:hypothetical protein